MLVIDSVLNNNNIKDFNIEKILGRFFEKELLLIRLWDINIRMTYYPDANSNIRDQVKTLSEFSSYVPRRN